MPTSHAGQVKFGEAKRTVSFVEITPAPAGGGFSQYVSQSGFSGPAQGTSVLQAPPGGIPPPPLVAAPWGPEPAVKARRLKPSYQHPSASRELLIPDQLMLESDLAEIHQLLGAAAFREDRQPDDVETMRQVFELSAVLGADWALKALLEIFKGNFGPGRSGYGPDFILPEGYLPSGIPADRILEIAITADFQPQQIQRPLQRDFGWRWSHPNRAEAEDAENAHRMMMDTVRGMTQLSPLGDSVFDMVEGFPSVTDPGGPNSGFS